MENLASPPPASANENSVKRILEWLALAHGRATEDAEGLLQQILDLRGAAVPLTQRVKLLDLLYAHADSIVQGELPRLRDLSLPISRKTRTRTRLLLDLLETLAQDYFNNLAGLFDPTGKAMGSVPQASLRRATLSLSWQIRIHHLVASPPRPGLWQQLHAAYRTARRLGVTQIPGPRDGASIEHLYIHALLTAIAQPASFSSDELEFIHHYVEHAISPPALSEHPSGDADSLFWIDLDRDFPAHALIRRNPGSDIAPLYFSCGDAAQQAAVHRQAIRAGQSAASLGLPDFADSHAGQGILQRLESLWGKPSKRKFPRRRQSYRANLCSGLDKLWYLLKKPDAELEDSEWMVINESPEGFALMHMSGDTQDLRVGDIVALKPHRELETPTWHVCIIRWAISENPEHIELGLQLLAARAVSAEIVQPSETPGNRYSALILPEAPPVRPHQALLLRPGLIKEKKGRIVVLIERDNLEIREMQATSLDEQTSAIEIFTVQPDEN